MNIKTVKELKAFLDKYDDDMPVLIERVECFGESYFESSLLVTQLLFNKDEDGYYEVTQEESKAGEPCFRALLFQ